MRCVVCLGIGCLLRGLHRTGLHACRRCFKLLVRLIQSVPRPAGCINSIVNWKVATCFIQCHGCARFNRCRLRAACFPYRLLRPLNITQRTCAPASLSEKYQCPLAARVKFETSPDTQNKGKLISNTSRAKWFSSVTLRIFCNGEVS